MLIRATAVRIGVPVQDRSTEQRVVGVAGTISLLLHDGLPSAGTSDAGGD